MHGYRIYAVSHPRGIPSVEFRFLTMTAHQSAILSAASGRPSSSSVSNHGVYPRVWNCGSLWKSDTVEEASGVGPLPSFACKDDRGKRQVLVGDSMSHEIQHIDNFRPLV
jgi:hypothetical protein